MTTQAPQTPGTRPDLLALTEDALTALGNRGLVKRAAKELAGGIGAAITVSDDGTIEAVYPDGVTTRLPRDVALTAAACTCAAPGLCRHRIGLVLAYQQQATPETAAPPQHDAPACAHASPAQITDDTLARVLGARSLESARKQLAKGIEAVVHPAAARVELPACTVTFHIPGDPAYATTDAAEPHRAEAVVLAVWALRAAEATGEQSRGADGVRVLVGGPAPASTPPTEARDSDTRPLPDVPLAVRRVLTSAAEVVDNLLLEGTANAGPLLRGNLRHVAKDLDAASMLWPAAAVEDLADQADWYAERSARHEMRRTADLICEFQARRRAVHANGNTSKATPRAILGTAEPRTTALKRIRLVGLGCRIGGGTGYRTAELFFAHPQDGTVLVLRRVWKVDEDNPPTTGQLRVRRIAGAPLHQIAAANLVSEAATRSASRVIALGSQSMAKTSVMPMGNAWTSLPEPLVIRDYAAFVERLARRGPRHLRPRVAAQDVFVLAVSRIERIGYDPAAQRLEAVVCDGCGGRATVSAEYRNVSKNALNVIAGALTGAAHGRPMLISGTVTVQAGHATLTPLAIWRGLDTALVVPDLDVDVVSDVDSDLGSDPDAHADSDPDLNPGLAHSSDDVTEAPAQAGSRHRVAPPQATAVLDQAADLLTEHAHRGVGMLAAAAAETVGKLSDESRRVGLTAISALLACYAKSLTAEDPTAQVRAWTDCSIAVDACR